MDLATEITSNAMIFWIDNFFEIILYTSVFSMFGFFTNIIGKRNASQEYKRNFNTVVFERIGNLYKESMKYFDKFDYKVGESLLAIQKRECLKHNLELKDVLLTIEKYKTLKNNYSGNIITCGIFILWSSVASWVYFTYF